MKKALVFITPVFVALLCISWGPTGHRTVAAIAEKHLTPNARQHIQELIGENSLADISNYADEVRDTLHFKHTAKWHYLDLQGGLTFEQFAAAVKADRQPNVYGAVLKCCNDLKSDTASKLTRILALKFLVHLVGDMHQPMHVSHAEDHGGNLIKVVYNDPRKPTNLHAVWDSKLIDQQPLTLDMRVADYDNASPEQIARWQSDDILMWAYESYAISEQIYADLAKRHGLNSMYYSTAIPIVRKRILQGGIRLAGLLNDIYK
ncbi:S1/P1 nuclease [Mucilaginibacter yixingensis]|uniref:S1/P1 nuclease n=1 Tax=Mucilaginibacter yixingensis TaxID=1295612 RepID=A0A2T5J4U5_9SPHI|nr:S1/P1 nuclease [Mucilaginibacter yixingensis]PTQ92698.1 S1/P1 nuclease [Mucilaginibacter yixingensis]